MTYLFINRDSSLWEISAPLHRIKEDGFGEILQCNESRMKEAASMCLT
jgi:hypothetical protein